MTAPEKIYRMTARNGLPALPTLVGKSRAWIYDAMRRGEFPEGVLLSPKCRVWPESQIVEWQRARGLIGEAEQ